MDGLTSGGFGKKVRADRGCGWCMHAMHVSPTQKQGCGVLLKNLYIIILYNI